MKEVKILVLEDSDIYVDAASGMERFAGKTRHSLFHADIAVAIRKNGQTRTVKCRPCAATEISGLVEEVSLAYAEGKL